MIRLTTRIGIIACQYLVQGYYDNRYISAPEIAEHYNMNIRALMPALQLLTKAGILRSRVGGTTPGFMYFKDPKGISLYYILAILAGEPHFEGCKELIANLKCDKTRCEECDVLSLFRGIIDYAKNKFSAINIVEYTK